MSRITHFILAATLVLSTLFACSQETPGVSNINSTKLTAVLAKGDPILLDVRTPEEVAAGVIGEPVVLDFYADNFEAELDKLDKSKVYVVYCKAGGRSAKAAKMMHEKGFKYLYNLEGGYDEYAK